MLMNIIMPDIRVNTDDDEPSAHGDDPSDGKFKIVYQQDDDNCISPQSSSCHNESHGENNFEPMLLTYNNHKDLCTPQPRSSTMTQKLSFAGDSDYYDRVDAIPKKMSFTLLDAAAILFSIGSFLFDIGTDVAVAAFHYINEDYWYFGLTMAFVLIPTLVMTGISMRWYVLDAREEGSPSISSIQWVMRFVFLMLQLGPILRYFDSLMYGLKFRQHRDKESQKKYFQYMIYEDTDATMLRLFECFMEAAPQLVLQIYILAKTHPHEEADHWTVVAQVIAVVASLVSLSWSLVSYHRALRMSLPDKKNLSWQGTAIQFVWRLFVIAARVLALALFASEFRFYIGIVCGIHWVLMFIWIVSMRTSFCDNRCEELGYNGVLAIMFIFCYFNPVDSPTRFRYTAYYTFLFAENTMLMGLWFFWCKPDKWYRLPAIIGHFLSFFTGLIFMVIYYLKLHPSGNVKIIRSDKECETMRQSNGRRNGYKRQNQNGLWTTQGRLLHPRPAVPTSSLPFIIRKSSKRHSRENHDNCIHDNCTHSHKGTIV